MKKGNNFDARDLELQDIQEDKTLANKIDSKFQLLGLEFYPKKDFPQILIEYLSNIYLKISETFESRYFFKKFLMSGTGDIHNLFIQKLLFKEKITKLDEKLRDYCEKVVGLSDNWDSEGSKAIKIETWNNTTVLLRKILYDLWYNEFEISIPLILPNTDGSIDIYWETEDFKLLINIPAVKNELVHIYGEKHLSPEHEIEVRINYELVQGVIIEWMKKIL